MPSVFDVPKPSRLAPKPMTPNPPAKLPADATLRDSNHYCDSCGVDKDGNPITPAMYKVGTPKGHLYFCGHHFRLYEVTIIANKYVVTELF